MAKEITAESKFTQFKKLISKSSYFFKSCYLSGSYIYGESSNESVTRLAILKDHSIIQFYNNAVFSPALIGPCLKEFKVKTLSIFLDEAKNDQYSHQLVFSDIDLKINSVSIPVANSFEGVITKLMKYEYGSNNLDDILMSYPNDSWEEIDKDVINGMCDNVGILSTASGSVILSQKALFPKFNSDTNLYYSIIDSDDNMMQLIFKYEIDEFVILTKLNALKV